MKYSIIVCHHCQTAKIIENPCKTTRCIRCGQRLVINQVKKFFETNKLQEAQNVIGFLNAKKDGKEEEFKLFLKNLKKR